jgi:hypothetical protein
MCIVIGTKISRQGLIVGDGSEGWFSLLAAMENVDLTGFACVKSGSAIHE